MENNNEYIEKKPLMEYISKVRGDPFSTPLIIAYIEKAPVKKFSSEGCQCKCKNNHNINTDKDIE